MYDFVIVIFIIASSRIEQCWAASLCHLFLHSFCFNVDDMLLLWFFSLPEQSKTLWLRWQLIPLSLAITTTTVISHSNKSHFICWPSSSLFYLIVCRLVKLNGFLFENVFIIENFKQHSVFYVMRNGIDFKIIESDRRTEKTKEFMFLFVSIEFHWCKPKTFLH